MYLTGNYAKYNLSSPLVLGLDVLYYTPGITLEDAANFPRVQVYRGLESFSVREDYSDPTSFFFFSQAGQAYHYHGHNDCGSFAFEMDDVRWANDLGKDDYALNLSGKYYWNYRKRTEGHNTLTINNADNWNQQEDKYSAVTRYEEGEGGAYAVYDMTELYRDVNKVQRGFYIDDDYSVVTVRDELDVKKDSEVYWFMHTKADIEILDSNTALLTQDGKSLTLQFVTDCPEFELSAMDAVPLPGNPVAEGQDPNKGFRKVAIRMQGSGKFNLTVRMSTQGTGEIKNVPIEKWEAPTGLEKLQKADFGYKLYVAGKLMEDPSVIPVIDEKELPKYSVVANDPSMSIVIENDPKTVDEKIALTIKNEDGTKLQHIRITYSKSSKAILDFFDSFLPVSAEVSEETEPSNNGGNLTDDNISTRWTGKAENAYAVLDYGSDVTFDALSLGFWKGNERNYTFSVFCSQDGKSFTEIGTFTSSGESDDYELYRLDRTFTARYIKFVNGGNSVNKYTNPTEILLLKALEG